MKVVMMLAMVVGTIPTFGLAQDNGATGLQTYRRGSTPPPRSSGPSVDLPVKSFSRNNWRIEIDLGRDEPRSSRWDDRLEHQVARLERKVERMEEVIDYLLYLNDRGGNRYDDPLYRCSMKVCRENNAFFCDSGDYRSEVAIGEDRIKLFDELKRRGVAYYSDTFACQIM